jgi:LPXTG-motif cell wall-anchored protein
MMKSTMKRMVLTGAAVAVMMSFAAPAMALPNVVDGGPGVIDPVVEPPPPPPPPEKCEKLPKFCDIPFDDIPVLENPVVTEPPKHCVLRPKLCGESPFGEDPLGENPVIDPVEDEDPVVTDPPENEEPVTDPPDKEEGPDKDEQPNTDGGSGGGNSSGGSSGSATTGGGSSGGSVSSASQTIDRGGNFVSSFLPYTLTTKMGDAGSAVKKNLPAPVAKSLPNTGGGWSFLILVGSALIAGGFAIRTLVRRKTSVTSTAQ